MTDHIRTLPGRSIISHLSGCGLHRRSLAAAVLGAGCAYWLSGCAGSGGSKHGVAEPASEVSAPAAAANPAPPLKLPPNAAPAPELQPLSFMVGTWVGVNPNQTVNEETWGAARGNNMTALYRQIRRDGKPALIEVTLVTVENGEITLRLRHLHGALEVPAKQANVSVFKLKAAADNRAEFTGTGDAEQVTSVVYRLVSPDQLAVDVAFAPTSKEKGFTSLYTRAAR